MGDIEQKPLHCANCVKPALSFLFLEQKYYCPVCYWKIYSTLKRMGSQVVGGTVMHMYEVEDEPWENKP